MNNELNEIIAKENCSRIQTICLDSSVKASIVSLTAWGTINIAIWFFLGAENREFFSARRPSAGTTYLMYGGLGLSLMFLAFALLGLAVRTLTIIFFDGLALVAVGIFNITHDFVVMGVLGPYYQVNPNTIWIMLGLCQIGWGFRQFSSYQRIKSWSPAHLTTAELLDLKKLLTNFTSMTTQMHDDIVKVTIKINEPFGLPLITRTIQYTGRLLNDCALMVSRKLDNYFIIDRKSINDTSFSDKNILKVNLEESMKKLFPDEISFIRFKQWAEKR